MTVSTKQHAPASSSELCPLSSGSASSEEVVSLWWAPLDSMQPANVGLERHLSPEESRRADRHMRPLDRRRFIAARGWLRRLLAYHLGCTPGDVPIVADGRGKPKLRDSKLQFSNAYSGGVALYALSWSMEVGVDVEAIRAIGDLDRIAARFFTDAEQRALVAMPDAQRRKAVFQCWTRKEAYAKGSGDGVTSQLDAAEVGLGGHSTVGSSWSVHQVDMSPGFAAAVAGFDGGGWIPSAPQLIPNEG